MLLLLCWCYPNVTKSSMWFGKTSNNIPLLYLMFIIRSIMFQCMYVNTLWTFNALQNALISHICECSLYTELDQIATTKTNKHYNKHTSSPSPKTSLDQMGGCHGNGEWYVRERNVLAHRCCGVTADLTKKGFKPRATETQTLSPFLHSYLPSVSLARCQNYDIT